LIVMPRSRIKPLAARTNYDRIPLPGPPHEKRRTRETTAVNQPKHNISAPQQFTNEIRFVESNGQHWVDVIVDGHKMRRHGPYSSADEAKGMAIQFAAVCRVFHQPMEVCRG